MKNSFLQITQTKVFPLRKSIENFKANAKVVLNDALVLNGLKIKKGRFGHYITFPLQKGSEPYTHFEPITQELRKTIQDSVLREYAKVLTKIGAH